MPTFKKILIVVFFLNMQASYLPFLQFSNDLITLKNFSTKVPKALASFESWYQKHKNTHPTVQVYETSITQQEFVDNLRATIKIQTESLQKQKIPIPHWLLEEEPQGIDFNKDNFLAIEARIIPNNSTIFCWGDLHGDIGSFVNMLHIISELKNKKGDPLLNDDFTLNQTPEKPVYFVFCGDLTDRGEFGIEILTTLAVLKQRNPHHVIICRGNHEEVNIIQHYGFAQELDRKFGNPDSLFPLLHQFYNSLPVTVLLGTKQGDFLQFFHGGLELIDITPVMKSVQKQSPAFQIIDHLDRISFFNHFFDPAKNYLIDKIGPSWFSTKELQTLSSKQDLTTEAFKKMPLEQQAAYKNALKGTLKQNDIAAFEKARATLFTKEQIKTFTSSPYANDIGYLWNDFKADPGSFLKETQFNTNRGTGLALGQELIEGILQQSETGAGSIKAIFRGHQHSDTMNQLTNQGNGGIYRLPYIENHGIFTSIAMSVYSGFNATFLEINLSPSGANSWQLTSRMLSKGKPPFVRGPSKLMTWKNAVD